MATSQRTSASTQGQPEQGFRGRVTSGLQSRHLPALRALISSVGEPLRVSGATGSALHGFDGFYLKPSFHLVVPRGRNVRRIGHHIHTTLDLDPIDCEEIWGIPILSPARMLIDIAATTGTAALTAALDGAIRDGLTTEDHLHRRIIALRGSGRYGIPRLLSVIEGIEITRCGQSWLEREYLRLIGGAGLPKPATQVVLGRRGTTLIRVDFFFPDSPVVVEVLGYRFHSTAHQQSIDAQRLNRLALDGKLVVQFTYEQVTTDPDYVLATTVEALATFITLPPHTPARFV